MFWGEKLACWIFITLWLEKSTKLTTFYQILPEFTSLCFETALKHNEKTNFCQVRTFFFFWPMCPWPPSWRRPWKQFILCFKLCFLVKNLAFFIEQHSIKYDVFSYINYNFSRLMMVVSKYRHKDWGHSEMLLVRYQNFSKCMDGKLDGRQTLQNNWY